MPDYKSFEKEKYEAIEACLDVTYFLQRIISDKESVGYMRDIRNDIENILAIAKEMDNVQ